MSDKGKEKEVTSRQVEEKRVKPTVIRRRAVAPVQEVPQVVMPPVPVTIEEKEPVLTEIKGEKKQPAAAKKPLKAIPAERKEGIKHVFKKSGRHAVELTKEPEPIKPLEADILPLEEAGKKREIKEIKITPAEKFVKKRTGAPGRRERKFELRDRITKIPVPVIQKTVKTTETSVLKPSTRVIKIADAISIGDLSQKLGIKAVDIIKKLIDMGTMVTINQFIDVDTAAIVASEFGGEVENITLQEDDLLRDVSSHVSGELKTRPPVVTVMGHVDHGKTSLLDAVRKTNVAAGEAGGITQHIGAYHVHLDKGDVTFLDTPGHEAFTSMRARGTKATDIVILVVAADDGVMPQTIEAVNHAKAANVPIIVAINKIDLPAANPQRVKQALTEYGLVPEDWGGTTIFCEVSAKKNTGIKELLELILLQADVLELKSDPKKSARGIVVEAKLDKGRGPVATVLIQEGTLKGGDAFIMGTHWGRIRAMINDWGKRVDNAGASMPVEVLGASSVPDAGDLFVVVRDEATAKQIAGIRQSKARESELKKTSRISLDELYDKIKIGEIKELGLIIKGDVHGSVEAVAESLKKLPSDAVKIKIMHSAVGGINEGDVMLASASNAIIIGFNIRPEPKVLALAEKEGVDIRLYSIIYDVTDDIKKAMEGMLAPTLKEKILGRAAIRDVFHITRVGNIAGCYVTDGKILRGANVRLIRDNVVIYNGKLSSLKRFKDDVKEVVSGYECGMGIENYNDIKAGDIIEAYVMEEVARKL
ncbi:MAG: translation initiation factor IF-2 [Deltaproteobacteria bacterium]|nr:translation initiation factor IF-2 [Deltaproteobacteria bacterium]